MSRKSWRELERKVREIEESNDPQDDVDLSVAWRDADPETRPTGMEYDPDEETLTYDVWSAQQETLTAVDGGEEFLDAPANQCHAL